MRVPLFVFAILLAVPLVGAQHEHMDGSTGMAMVLHDGPDSGRAVVGSTTHFGFALLDPKGVPTVHQNAEFLVALDNVTVFSTKDTHEYDGLFSLDMVFGHAGHYVVTAMSGKMAMGVFEGDAVDAVNETVAKVNIKLQSTAPSNAVGALIDIVGPDGKTLPHTDAILEWRSSAGALVARYHTHIHEKPIALTQAFDLPGDYRLTVTAYKAFPTGKGADVRAVFATATATAGQVAVPANPDVSAFPPPTMAPAGPKASAAGLTLYGMFDPQNQVGVGFPIRVSGLIEGNDSMPKPHVDFSLTVNGPRGMVFQSKSLHEYDAHLEWLYVPQVPGAYDVLMIADMGEAKISLPMHFQVIPPAAPVSVVTGAGIADAVVDVKGLEKLVAGVPANLTFSVMGPSGPIQHSEVDVTIAKKGEAPIYNFKLHTHDSGTTQAIVVFPTAGDWTIQIDPSPTDAQPLVFSGPGGVGAPIVFAAKAAPGALVVAPGSAGTAEPVKTVPGFEPVVAALALLGCALLVQARRKD